MMHLLAAMLLTFVTSTPPATEQHLLPPDVVKLIHDLQSQVQSLQAKVDDLGAQQKDARLTEQRADQIRGLIHDVLADADSRASLLQSGTVAGYDKGFFLRSADGSFTLKIAGQIQVRAVYNSQENAPIDDNRFGFELRRMKLFFSGNIVDPTWTYSAELSASSSTGTLAAGEFVYVQKDLGEGWMVRTGQFKAPFSREEYISARRIHFVERSLVNSQFTTGVSQGVQLEYMADRWRAYGTVTDGANATNTAWNAEDTEYAFTGRLEWLAMGDDWKSTEDLIAWHDGGTSVLLGGAVLYQNAEYGTGNNLPSPDFNNAEIENLSLTADVSAKFEGGYSAAAAVFYRRLVPDSPASTTREQLAAAIQAGIFLTNDLEALARFEWGKLDIATIDELAIITLGLNKYFSKHALKWQNDIGYSFNSLPANWASTSAGWLADSPDEDGQIVIRSQFQLLF